MHWVVQQLVKSSINYFIIHAMMVIIITILVFLQMHNGNKLIGLSKFDRKVKVKWPSNMKLQQRKKRMKEKANGGKNNKTSTKDVVFNMFYGDNL